MTLQAEKERRIERTMDLLATKTPQQVIDAVIKDFGIHKRTAHRYITAARDRISAAIDVTRAEWIADTLHQLDRIIRTGETRHRLDAIAQRTSLLGLQAPAVHVVLSAGLYSGPEQLQALGDPGLRERALSFEVEYARVRSQQNGDPKGNGQGDTARASDAAAKHAGLPQHPRLPAPPPPTAPPEGGADFTNI